MLVASVAALSEESTCFARGAMRGRGTGDGAPGRTRGFLRVCGGVAAWWPGPSRLGAMPPKKQAKGPVVAVPGPALPANAEINAAFHVEVQTALAKIRGHPVFASIMDEMPIGIDEKLGDKSGYEDGTPQTPSEHTQLCSLCDL
jgi:hypothetical protein